MTKDEYVLSKVRSFDKKTKEGDRFYSWRYCYDRFNSNMDDCSEEDRTDYLALNLAFYLASWGMYRGSSFLLQYDYTIHKKAVRDYSEVQREVL